MLLTAQPGDAPRAGLTVRASIRAHLPGSVAGTRWWAVLPQAQGSSIPTARVAVLHQAGEARPCSPARPAASEALLVPLIKNKIAGGKGEKAEKK